MREVWEVAACHVGKQTLARDEGAQCESGWDVLATALLVVCWALIPGRGFARCYQRHNWLRNLGGTVQVLAVAPSCSEGMLQAGWARDEEMPEAHPSRLALEKALSKPGAAAGSWALGMRQSADQLLCGHRGVHDTSSLGCFLVTGQLPAVPPLPVLQLALGSFCSLFAAGDGSYSAAARFQGRGEMSHSSAHVLGKPLGRSPADAHVRFSTGRASCRACIPPPPASHVPPYQQAGCRGAELGSSPGCCLILHNSGACCSPSPRLFAFQSQAESRHHYYFALCQYYDS